MKDHSSGSQVGLHVAIIMDGSGRWASARGWSRSAGHLAGVRVVRQIADAAPSLGVGTLTLHCFSAENWNRPADEVSMLLGIFEDYLRNEIAHWLQQGVRVSVIGRRNRVPQSLREAMARAEAATESCRGLHLRLAIDYSSREAILGAAAQLKMIRDLPEFAFPRALTTSHGGGEAPDVDLLIRTGGEQRLSDFMLWECAYAELFFSPLAWPEFSAKHLSMAIDDFRSRDRRYGRIAEDETVREVPHPSIVSAPQASWRG
ncbi:MAG: polyprenyl diphosphate synthase [Deltaproteobacteria bacterium]